MTQLQIRYVWHDLDSGQPAEARAQAAARAGRQWGLPVGSPAPDGYQD